jgi:hypothetical protein
VATAAAFAAAGYWLDVTLGTVPVFVVVGLVLGAFGGFVHLFAVVAPEMLPWNARRRRRSGSARADEEPDDS